MRNTVMATSGRKGTFLTLSSLERNPKVFVHGQLFSYGKDSRDPFIRGLTSRQIGERCFDRQLLECPDDAAIVFPVAPGMIETDNPDGFWAWVDTQPNIQLLHMRRRNLLRGFVSLQVAHVTNTWSTRYPQIGDEPQVTIDYKHAETVIRRDLRESRECQKRYCDRPHLTVFYEDLVKHYEQQMSLIQTFLGVPPLPCWPKTKKQAKRTLRDAITNYDELAAAWKGTEFEQYLDGT